MRDLRSPAVAVAMLTGTLSGLLCSAGEYTHPVAAIPYAWRKPTIDGVVEEAEWRGAMSHQALQTVRKQISTRQARFWMMWDEEHLYVAMRCPMRKGERVINALRDRARETNVVFDDSYEIWVSVGATDPLTGQPNCTTQFLGNFSGARYDALHQPAVGNSRTSSYVTGWEPRNRITPNNEWEFEVVIARASLGTTPEPFHDGQHIRFLIARNFKRPWEQNSFEGTSSFSVVETHSEFVMSKSAPALHLLSVGDSVTGKIGLHLATQGQADTEIRWQCVSDSTTRGGTAVVRKGVYQDVANLPAVDTPDGGQVRVTVSGADGTTLLDWAALREFGYERKRDGKDGDGKPKFVQHNPATDVLDDPGDRLDLRLTFNPERDYARVFGDLVNYDNRDAIKEILLTVTDAAGNEVKRAKATIDEYAYARALIMFEALAPGEYHVRLDCRDANGNVVASKDTSFAKSDLAEKYEWWHTKRGSIEKVIRPWTPVLRREQRTGLLDRQTAIDVWGRKMTVGPAGLPRQVVTQEQDILASPARLVATLEDGRRIEAQGTRTEILFDTEYRQTVRVSSTLGDLGIRSDVTVECDGLYKVTMTLTPAEPTKLRSLQLVLPYAEAMAEYVHAVTAEIRSGFFYGFTPRGTGRVWDCTLLGDKSMQVGSFVPYIWLGSTKGGLCWFADSDQGWTPNDDTPAIEIRRDRKGEVDLVLNLISARETLTEPRTITFGLQASPVKPMHRGWREDKWWCGDTFKPYAHNQNLIFASTPFVVPNYAERARKLVEAQHKAGRPAVPYFIHVSLPTHLVPEMADFAEQWKTTVDDALCYRGSLNDFMIHNWSKWAEDYQIDGYYIDNMRPILCDNTEHGCGYRLPDGRIQPTFQMFDTRDYFLRSRAAFLEQRPESKLVLHMTNSMVIPWVGAADVAYDGEHHVIYPEMGKDFMDFWSLERLRVDVPSQWGVAVNFMQEYQGSPWDPTELHAAFRAYFAAVMLHDALPTGNENGHARHLVKQRHEFGIGDDDVRFLPYWERTGLTAAGEDVKLAGWLKPDRLLLLVANFGEKHTADVSLDPRELGWGGSAFIVTDAEAGYKQNASRRVEKTADELAAERAEFERKEAARIENIRQRYEKQAENAKAKGKPVPKAPNMTPKPYREQRFRNVPLVVWDGDRNAPVTPEGAKLSVPVERHNYRLLVVTPK